MSIPQIPEGYNDPKWVRADESEVISHLQDLMPFNEYELKTVASRVSEEQAIYPKFFQIENDGWKSNAGNFCLDEISVISLIDFLQQSLKRGQKEIVVGTSTFYDDEECEYVCSLVVCPKTAVGTHVEENLIKKIRQNIADIRKNEKENLKRKEEREVKKEKLAELIGKFQNKEITFDDFQIESAKLR